VEAPRLEITPSAAEMLRRIIASISEYQPVVVLSWVLGSSQGRLLPNGEEDIQVRGPHWGIGLHPRAELPSEEVVELAGLPFTFGAYGAKLEWLNGATLDYANGQFDVAKRAI
jgi:hypothetical protein